MSQGRAEQTGKAKTSAEMKALEREARVARALRQVAGALGASLELDELLELVLSKLTELMSAERALLFLLDERKRELVSRSAGGDDDFPIRLPLGEGLLSRVARSGRGLRLQPEELNAEEIEWSSLLSCSTKSAIAAPLKNNLSRTIGVILVINKKRGGIFDDEDEEILSVLAKQAAIAIDNSRLLVTLIRKNQQLQQAQEQLTRRVRDLELLFELERSTAHALSHEDLARAVLENLARACNAEAALLVLEEGETHEYVDYCLTRAPRIQGEIKEGAARFYSGISEAKEGILARVIASSQAIQIDSADAPLQHRGLPPVQSMIAEALEGEERPTGALSLINKRGGPFTAEDLGLLRLVSANMSTAVRLFNASQARERQERLSSIGRLMSQVVHDLKSPLTVISGYVQLMEESNRAAERHAYAEEILKQFQALGAMQREVLAFARGETQVFARKVIVDRLLSDLSEQMRPELADKKVRLHVSAAPRLLAQLDSERIMRALQNLIRNASEALAPLGGGSVTVRADADEGTFRLRVSDTGPGIPAAIAPRLFQSFVTAGKAEGTGLGLAIVKRIVEEHGGKVRLEPSTRGACFLIEIPDAVLPGPAEALQLNGAGAPQQKTKNGVAKKKSVKKEVAANSSGQAAKPLRSSDKAAKKSAKKSAPKEAAAKKSSPKKVSAKSGIRKKAQLSKGSVKAPVAKNVSKKKVSAQKTLPKKKVLKKVAAEKASSSKAASSKATSNKAAGRKKKAAKKVSQSKSRSNRAKP